MTDEFTQVAMDTPDTQGTERVDSWLVPFGLDRTLEAVEHSGFDTETNVVTVTELQSSDVQAVVENK